MNHLYLCPTKEGSSPIEVERAAPDWNSFKHYDASKSRSKQSVHIDASPAAEYDVRPLTKCRMCPEDSTERNGAPHDI